MRRISTPSILMAGVCVSDWRSRVFKEPCMAREKIAQHIALCNRCCTTIDTMQRTMLYSATLIAGLCLEEFGSARCSSKQPTIQLQDTLQYMGAGFQQLSPEEAES
jgi:hypothetical protein